MLEPSSFHKQMNVLKRTYNQHKENVANHRVIIFILKLDIY